MATFKQTIEGMKAMEQPETPKQPTAKKEAPLADEPKAKESEFSKSRPAFTHDFAESLRKDAINWANEKMPYDKSLPKILNNYTRDQVIDFMRGNIGEDEIMKRAKERNGINQDRVNLLAKQEARKTIDQSEANKAKKNMGDTQNQPKKTVGEELQEFYEREFFKEANGNKEDFVNSFINRFGVPKGFSRKEMAEFYGNRFDELSANQPKAQQPRQGSFERAIRDIGDAED